MAGAFVVKINGTIARVPNEVIVESSLHHPDSVELRWSDASKTMLDNFSIGDDLTVEGTAGQTTPMKIAEVEITALEAVMEGGTYFSVVRGLDKSHRLHRGTLSVTYEKATAGTIAKQVASKAGVQIDTKAFKDSKVKYDAVTQFNETPWNFLRRLGVENNRMVTVTKEGKLSFLEPAAPNAPDKAAKDDRILRVGPGGNVTQLHATLTTAQQVPEVEVRGWDAKNQKAVKDGKPSKSKAIANDKKHTPTGLYGQFKGAKPAKHTVVAPNLQKGAEVSAAASLGERLGSGLVEIQGEIMFNPRLRAGESVTLVNAGAHFNGKYILSAVRHLYDKYGGARTEFSVTGDQDRSLAGIVAGADGGNGTNGRYWGVYPAVVSDNKDKESKEARVKVWYPWLSETKVASGWARVVHPGAGKDRGLFVLPSTNDEVLVAFENGDPSRPVVLGGLYNDQLPVPYHPGADKVSNAGKANQAALTTEKHALQMYDKDKSSKQTLILGTRDNKFVITVTTDKDGLISIASKGKVEITASKDISIKSEKGKVSIKGCEVEIASTQKDIALKAAVGFSAKATKAEINGTGTTTIKGGTLSIN